MLRALYAAISLRFGKFLISDPGVSLFGILPRYHEMPDGSCDVVRRVLVDVVECHKARVQYNPTRKFRYYEENIMESYFHPEIDHHIGSGP